MEVRRVVVSGHPGADGEVAPIGLPEGSSAVSSDLGGGRTGGWFRVLVKLPLFSVRTNENLRPMGPLKCSF